MFDPPLFNPLYLIFWILEFLFVFTTSSIVYWFLVFLSPPISDFRKNPIKWSVWWVISLWTAILISQSYARLEFAFLVFQNFLLGWGKTHFIIWIIQILFFFLLLWITIFLYIKWKLKATWRQNFKFVILYLMLVWPLYYIVSFIINVYIGMWLWW